MTGGAEPFFQFSAAATPFRKKQDLYTSETAIDPPNSCATKTAESRRFPCCERIKANETPYGPAAARATTGEGLYEAKWVRMPLRI